MKSFGAILIALAASGPFVAALPAPGSGHGIEARGPIYHTLQIRDLKRGKTVAIRNETATADPASSAAPPLNSGTPSTEVGQDPTEDGQAEQAAGGGGPLAFLEGLLGNII